MMVLRLFRIELLKVRRSLVLLMTLACPLSVVVLVFVMNLRTATPQTLNAEQMAMLLASVSAMWSWFMLPLFIALSTGLINGNEHRNQTWRLMLSLPIGKVELFSAKAMAAMYLMLGAHIVLLTGTALAIGVLGMLGFPLTDAFNVRPVAMLWAAPVAALPLLVIQHMISWRLRSVVPALAIAVVATFASIQIGSSDYWPYFPWTYPLVATNASSEGARVDAVLLGAGLAALLFSLSAWWVQKREVA